jgi:Uncharacterized protein conserved in bacteria (DUF2252)
MNTFAGMDVLETWYSRVDDSELLAMLPKDRRTFVKKRIAKATAHSSSELVFPKLVEEAGKQPRIREDPPVLFHPDAVLAATPGDELNETVAEYRHTLADDRRVLFDRYRLVDCAVKVVGIGSVGTLCMVALFMSMAATRCSYR